MSWIPKVEKSKLLFTSSRLAATRPEGYRRSIDDFRMSLICSSWQSELILDRKTLVVNSRL